MFVVIDMLLIQPYETICLQWMLCGLHVNTCVDVQCFPVTPIGSVLQPSFAFVALVPIHPRFSIMDLSRLGTRKSFISQSGVAELLDELKKAECLPTTTSRNSIKRARLDVIDVSTPYGKMVREWQVDGTEGKKVTIHYVHPAAHLWYMVHNCEPFSAFMEELLRDTPSSPQQKYQIVLYADEVSPGNQLKTDNRRKCYVYYWALLATCCS